MRDRNSRVRKIEKQRYIHRLIDSYTDIDGKIEIETEIERL